MDAHGSRDDGVAEAALARSPVGFGTPSARDQQRGSILETAGKVLNKPGLFRTFLGQAFSFPRVRSSGSAAGEYPGLLTSVSAAAFFEIRR